MKAFTVKFSDLARHGSWSVAFHRLMQTLHKPGERVEAFNRFLDDLGVKRVDIDRMLRDAKSETQAIESMMQLIQRRSKDKSAWPAGMLALVRELAASYIAREQAELDVRLKRMADLRGKYRVDAVNKSAADLVRQLLDDDIEGQLRTAARRIKHCGDYGTLFFNRQTKEVHWTAGDADGEPDYTSMDDVQRILKVRGVSKVNIGDEWSPDENKGWKRLN